MSSNLHTVSLPDLYNDRMATRLYQHKSFFETIPDRLHYAWSDPEQQFEWNILTRRRIFRNLCNFPTAMVEWHMRRPETPYFPQLNHPEGTKPENALQWIQSNHFTGLLLKNTLDATAKFGLSAYIKTALFGYHNHEQYRRILSSSDELLALANTALLVDPSTSDLPV